MKLEHVAKVLYKGTFKGDVALFKVPENIDSEKLAEDIKDEKKKIVDALNTTEGYEPCNGCPFIENKDWQNDPLVNGIKYMSLEYHSICNMRCDYCSEMFYGGETQKYDVTGLIKHFKKNNAFEGIDYIVWGGGEPTLGKDFNKSLEEIAKVENIPKIRMITNSTIHNETIQSLIDENKLFIVTSIDAGKEETFTEVRGLNAFHKVLTNLKKYSEKMPRNVIIKYIVKENTLAASEIDSFIKAIVRYDLQKCYFQISGDFRDEVLNEEEIAAMIHLYNKLVNTTNSYIFFDDLILQRLPLNYNKGFLSKLDSNLIKRGLSTCDYLSEKSPQLEHLAIIGTGAQARVIARKIKYFSNGKQVYFVDPTNLLEVNEIDGLKLLSMKEFRNLRDKTCVSCSIKSGNL